MTTTTMVTTEETTSLLGASRKLSFSGRRNQRAAGERVAGLFEEHGRMVYGVCRLVLRDPVEAEDAAQQTFLSAYRGLLAGQEPRDPSAWLGTIARNECRTRLRAQRTEPLTLVTAVSGDDTQRDVGRRAEIEALCAALAELPQQQRDAIVLREFYGLSYAEVAGALGLSGAAVESLIFRSRKRLQQQLRPMRSALGVLTLPLTLRDSLAQVLPGFGGAGASAGAGAAVLAKVGSAPLAAKIAAATLAVGTAGVAGVETHHAERRAQAAPKRHVAAQVRELVPARAARTAPVVKVSLAAETTPKRSSGSDRSESSDERSGTSGGHEQSQLEPRDQSDHSGPSGHEEQTQVEPAATPEPEGGHGGDSGSGGGGDSGTGSGSGDSGSGDGHSGSGSGDSGS
jgi:RNA polymerase sigma factor (sigma-70 family)